MWKLLQLKIIAHQDIKPAHILTVAQLKVFDFQFSETGKLTKVMRA